MVTPRRVVAYGLSDALPNVFPAPIVAKRVPTSSDIGYLFGQVWLVPASNVAYMLVSVVANVATWNLLESSGSSGVFSSLTVTPGPISLTGTTGINVSGAGVTTINTGGTGALNLGNATGNTAVTGSLGTTTSLSAGTTVTAGTGLTVTLGNATLTNGNLVLSTAATYVSLPGPVNIMSGAGAPAAGLAVNVGDMYINTTAASATTRLYIATAASTWTYIAANA